MEQESGITNEQDVGYTQEDGEEGIVQGEATTLPLPVDMSRAQQIDGEARKEWRASERSMTKLGGLLSKMREEKLWKLLTDDGGKPYGRFEEYVSSITGDGIARTTLYNMLAIHGLTQGPHALNEGDVDAMGPKRAAQVARLEPEDRTPEIIEVAKTESLAKVKAAVQEKLNEALPEQERREVMITITRTLHPKTVELIERVEENALYMEGVRDGDKSLSLVDKTWYAIFTSFEMDRAEELAEGREYRLAMEARDAIKKNSDEEDDDLPPEPADVEAEMRAAAGGF